jgi:hypothetical protein
MRSIWIALIGPAVSEVGDLLSASGFEHSDGSNRWNYPGGESAALYVSCGDMSWVEKYGLQEEWEELLEALEGEDPTVRVNADVSGRVPGDEEVRFLSTLLLGQFKGAAFDDWFSYSHAWSLSEIQEGTLVDGVHFFDYRGWHDQDRQE